MNKLCIGLTGGVASGKTTAADFFKAWGVTVVDTDVIAHQITAPDGVAIAPLKEALGAWAFAPDGRFNRPAVRQRVFSDSDNYWREKLEAVLHPLIRGQLVTQLAAATSPYAIGVVPLLNDKKTWQAIFGRILVVDIKEPLQISRAHARDGTQDAKKIIAAQISAAQRRQMADDIITNNGSVADLKKAVARQHRQYLQLVANRYNNDNQDSGATI